MATKKQIIKAIFKTLIYANIFDYPLTYAEIKKWLIEQTIIDLDRYISELKKIKFIKKIGQYYFLKGRQNIINIRGERKHWAEEKYKIARKEASFLSRIPTIKLIGISGALAMNNTKVDDDIDLFIITSSTSLWTTRFLSTLLLDLKGVRRHPGSTVVNNKICLNMFIDENHLSIPKTDRNIFTAHEVLQMKPIYEKENMHQRFLFSNLWVKKYLSNAFPLFRHSESHPVGTKNRIITNILEEVLRSFQLFYMKSRRSKEIITGGIIRFHPHDAKDWVIKKYKDQLRVLAESHL